jgi:TonB-dependent starch-binding outer membrane protein SusC
VRTLAVWIASAAVAFGASVAAAQEREVTGTVVREADGQPITEAAVSVVGGARTARTNVQGRYSITVGAGDARLAVRAIGYQRVEISVPAGVTTADVRLKEDIFKLDELVVSGQQTGVERRNSTTSTSIVTGEDLSQVQAASVDQALQGKVAGAVIQQNSGGPGGGLQVQVRGGANTAIGASDPLFVVDGVLYSNATLPSGLFTVTGSSSNRGNGELQDDAVNRLADLNPSDIASIEVLKGAAASSIYGSKAANGAVIITTNRGKVGKPRVNFTQRLGAMDLLRAPGQRTFDEATARAEYGDEVVDGALSVGAFQNYDHVKELLDHRPFIWESQGDVSGGDDNTKYFVSGGWKQDKGVVQKTGAERQSIRLNLDQKLSNKWQLSVSTAFNRTMTDRGITNNDNNGGSVTYALAYIPSFVPLLNTDGTFREPEQTYAGSNPLQTAALSTNNELVTRFTGGATVTFNAITTERSSLRLVGAAGGDLFSQKATVVAPPELFWQQSLALPGVSGLSNGDSRFLNWNLNAIHTYAPTSASWKATTSVGTQYEDRNLSRAQVVASGMLPGQTNIDQGSVLGRPFELATQERTFALYAQEELSMLRDRLFLTLGVRGERSSANGDQNKFYFFPKISSGYRFANALGQGSDIKIRGAYGETGNQPLFGQKFTTLAGGTTIGGVIGTQVGTTSGAPEIKPERVKEFEGGVDLTFLGGRGTFEFTAFHRHTTDLLLSVTPAASTGFTQQIINGGQFRTSGIEVAFGVSPVQSRNASWLVRSTFQRNRTNVDNLPGGDTTGFRPANAGFGLAFGEFFVQPGRPIQQIIGTIPDPEHPGELIDAFLGDANPNFRLTLSNDITIHALSFSMLWDWQQGGVAQNQTLSLYDCNGLAPDGYQADTPWNNQVRFDACNTDNADARSYVQSTSFIKLRELSVGLELPRSIARAFAGASRAKVSLTGRNLLLFTNYFGYDPEVSNYGQQAIVRNIDLGPYPPMRSFLFNVQLGF